MLKHDEQERTWQAPRLVRVGTIESVAHHEPWHKIPPGQCKKLPILCS